MLIPRVLLLICATVAIIIISAPKAQAQLTATNVQPLAEIGPFQGGQVTETAWQLSAKQIEVKIDVAADSTQTTNFDVEVFVCAEPGGGDCNSRAVWRPFTLPAGDHSHTYQALFSAHTLNLYSVSYEVYDEDASYPALANYTIFFPGALAN